MAPYTIRPEVTGLATAPPLQPPERPPRGLLQYLRSGPDPHRHPKPGPRPRSALAYHTAPPERRVGTRDLSIFGAFLERGSRGFWGVRTVCRPGPVDGEPSDAGALGRRPHHVPSGAGEAADRLRGLKVAGGTPMLR